MRESRQGLACRRYVILLVLMMVPVLYHVYSYPEQQQAKNKPGIRNKGV